MTCRTRTSTSPNCRSAHRSRNALLPASTAAASSLHHRVLPTRHLAAPGVMGFAAAAQGQAEALQPQHCQMGRSGTRHGSMLGKPGSNQPGSCRQHCPLWSTSRSTTLLIFCGNDLQSSYLRHRCVGSLPEPANLQQESARSFPPRFAASPPSTAAPSRVPEAARAAYMSLWGDLGYLPREKYPLQSEFLLGHALLPRAAGGRLASRLLWTTQLAKPRARAQFNLLQNVPRHPKSLWHATVLDRQRLRPAPHRPLQRLVAPRGHQPKFTRRSSCGGA